MKNWNTTRELEEKTVQISYEKAIELMNSPSYLKVQETPKNLYSTCSIRLDETQGGIFLWSGGMQRYYLIAKLKGTN